MSPFMYISARLDGTDPILSSAFADDGNINIEEQIQNRGAC